MARDNKARLELELVLLALDGARPSGPLQWASAAAPVVTQAAVGAGHWAAGRRQRALAAWASAAGSALAAWGLGTEAPTRAEMVENTQQHRDALRKPWHTPKSRLPLSRGRGLRISFRPLLEEAAERERGDLGCAQLRDEPPRRLPLGCTVGDHVRPGWNGPDAHTSTSTGRIIGRRLVRS